MRHPLSLRAAATLVAWAAVAAPSAAQCVMCGTSAQGSGDPISRGLMVSFAFMVVSTVGVFATVATWIWRRYRG